MKTGIIINPASGKYSDKVCERVYKRLCESGHTVEMLKTDYPGHARELACKLAENTDLVIAGGGDGTFSQVASGLADTGVPMGIIPLGTANMLGYEIGVGFDIDKAIQTLLSGEVKAVHLGKCDRGYFLMAAGIGFDARTVQNLDPRLKAIAGKGAFVASGLQVLLAEGLDHIFEVTLDDEPTILTAQSVIIHKTAHYAGQFKVVPDLCLDIPEFCVSLFPPAGRFKLIQNLLRYIHGYQLTTNEVHCLRTRKVRVRARKPADNTEQPVQMDGEMTGTLPFEAELAENALRLITRRKERNVRE